MAKDAPARLLTVAELAEFDGSAKDRPVLVAYDGWIYDVTNSFPWAGGRHWACARAGRDETEKMKAAPHGPELLDRLSCVGRLIKNG